jgi:hypothetical protein
MLQRLNSNVAHANMRSTFCLYQVSSVAFLRNRELLAIGFTNGVFGLYSMPNISVVHSLSIAQTKITSCAINRTGEWLAFACSRTGQLLVWEWQSETCRFGSVALACCVVCHQLILAHI